MKFYFSLKTRLSALAILLLLAMPGSTPIHAGDDAFDMALSLDLPGRKNTGGRGGEFNTELYRRLIAAGGEAYLITFNWTASEGTPRAGMGQIVAFRDGHGRYWGTNCFKEQPVWLGGKTPQKWVECMFPTLEVKCSSVQTDPRFTGRAADRSRAPEPTPAPTVPASLPAAPPVAAEPLPSPAPVLASPPAAPASVTAAPEETNVPAAATAAKEVRIETNVPLSNETPAPAPVETPAVVPAATTSGAPQKAETQPVAVQMTNASEPDPISTVQLRPADMP